MIRTVSHTGWDPDSDEVQVQQFRMYRSTSTSLLREIMRAEAPGLIGVVLYRLAAGALLVASVFLIRHILDVNDLVQSIVFLLLFLLCSLVAALFNYASSKKAARVAAQIRINLTHQLLTQAQGRLSVPFGATLSLLQNDVLSVASLFPSLANNLLLGVSLSLFSLLAIVQLLGFSGIIVFLLAFLQVPISLLISARQKPLRQQASAAYDAFTDDATAALEANQFLVANRLRAFFLHIFERNYQRHAVYTMREHAISIALFTVSYCWWIVTIAGLVLLGLFQTQGGAFQGIIATAWLIIYISDALGRVPLAFESLRFAQAAQHRIELFCAHKPFDSHDVTLPERCLERIEFRHVSVKFDGQTFPQDFSASIHTHARTLLLGTPGSGKTTLVKLTLGELMPDEGQVILVDDQGKEYAASSAQGRALTQRTIAFVPQRSVLIDDSILNNMTFGFPFSSEDVRLAVEQAQLQSDLEHFEEGLDHRVGSQGNQLSGGQQQRVNLARAFLKKADFLLLDDPFSALDVKRRQAITQTLNTNSFLLVTSSEPLGLEFDQRIQI